MNLSFTIPGMGAGVFAGKAWAAETGGEAAGGVAGHAAGEGGHGGQTQGTEIGRDAGGGDHGGAFPPFDPASYASQLVWLAITFGIFYMIMGRTVLPRIAQILETRSDRISQDIDEAQRLKEEAEAAQAAYEHELAEARNRAHAIGQEARDKAKAEADAERETVERDLNAKLESADARIAEIKTKALAEVDGIAADTAEAIIGQLIGGRLTKAEVAKAVADTTGGKA